MDEGKARTLAEWRKLRGMSREQLARRVGVEPERVARWEEVGYDFHMHSNEDEVLMHRIADALNLGRGGMASPPHTPATPYPGDYVISYLAVPRVHALLEEHGLLDELVNERELSAAVPTPYGVAVKPWRDVTVQEFASIAAWQEEDHRLYVAKMERVMDLFARGREHGMREDETLGEAYGRTSGFGTGGDERGSER